MPSVVVPVGFESGTRWYDGKVHHEVILPAGSGVLPPELWQVWWSAYADLEGAQALTLTRQRLSEIAAKLGVADAPTHVSTLFENGLLATLDTDKPADFLRAHRLLPLADGFGATEQEPNTYRIGREDKVLLNANIDVYGIWCISAYHASIWDAIAFYSNGVNASPDEVAESVAQALPLIIANRCGFLQPS